jgi:hypothetical protein
MDAIFTLPYSEYAVADLLTKNFPPSHGYSVFVPVSRTEKGIDLVLTQRVAGETRCVTFQVKSSRTYPGTPAKREGAARRFKYYTWLNSFKVPEQADFIVLFGLLPPDDLTGRKLTSKFWQSHVMLFSQVEMKKFMDGVKTKKTQAPDSKFGFGFDNSQEAFLTRGNACGDRTDYSDHIFKKQLSSVRSVLGGN